MKKIKVTFREEGQSLRIRRMRRVPRVDEFITGDIIGKAYRSLYRVVMVIQDDIDEVFILLQPEDRWTYEEITGKYCS